MTVYLQIHWNHSKYNAICDSFILRGMCVSLILLMYHHKSNICCYWSSKDNEWYCSCIAYYVYLYVVIWMKYWNVMHGQNSCIVKRSRVRAIISLCTKRLQTATRICCVYAGVHKTQIYMHYYSHKRVSLPFTKKVLLQCIYNHYQIEINVIHQLLNVNYSCIFS